MLREIRTRRQAGKSPIKGSIRPCSRCGVMVRTDLLLRVFPFNRVCEICGRELLKGGGDDLSGNYGQESCELVCDLDGRQGRKADCSSGMSGGANGEAQLSLYGRSATEGS
jgi:hypothetical protein